MSTDRSIPLPTPRSTTAQALSLLLWFSLNTVFGNIILGRPAIAPIVPATDGTSTNVNQFGNQSQITGGTRAGENLFHSFQQFGIGHAQVANFLAQPDITNIFSRVTGGQTSVINGLLQVTGGSANLFLSNQWS
jgi:filamentous hemagglutinin family protein